MPPRTPCAAPTPGPAPALAVPPQPAPARGRSQHSPRSGCHQVTGIVGQAGTTQCCGFLFGTQYHFQMRCRRSSARGYWSEWSPGRNYTTHEKGGCGVTRGGVPSARPGGTAAVAWPRSPLSVPRPPFSCCSPRGEAGRVVERSAGRGGWAAGGAAALEGEHRRAVGARGLPGHRPGDRASPWGPSVPAHPACAQAPRRREANGRVLGYRVTLSPRRRGRDPPTVCNTTHTQCNFSAPTGTRRVYLSAYNAAGESAATEVVLLERKGEGSANLPWSETSVCPPGALPPTTRQLHELSNCVPLPRPVAGETPPWVCNRGAPEQAARRVHSQGEEQGRLRAGGHRGTMRQGCSPLLSSRLVVPMQVSPWPGSGLCPGVSTASGCAGRHRRPRWPPTSWSGSGCPRSPAAAAPAGRWSMTGLPPQPSSGVSWVLPGGPCPPGWLHGEGGVYQGAGTPPDCPRTKPCSEPTPHPPSFLWIHSWGTARGRQAGTMGQAQGSQGLSVARAPNRWPPLCSLLQMALSLSSGTTSRCTPSTRMPSGCPSAPQPTPSRRVGVLPAAALGAPGGSPHTIKPLPFKKESQPSRHIPLIQGLCRRAQPTGLDLGSSLKGLSAGPSPTGAQIGRAHV